MMMSSRAASVSLCVLLASVAVCAAQSAPASQPGTFGLWAIDDMVRIDPETEKTGCHGSAQQGHAPAA